MKEVNKRLEVVVIEVESYLNDRPLTYVSDSLGDATALTPSKLINGFNLNSPHFTNEELKFNNPDNLVRHLSFRYRMTLKVKSYFCKRWEKEYLAALRERQRSHPGITRQVSLEDIVLIKEDGPRRNWRMGKVVKIHGGGDGYIRSVDLKTAHGIISRPVKLLYPLELSCEDFRSPTGGRSIRKAAAAALKILRVE